MKDIVERLRSEELLFEDEELVLIPLCRQAADEIERLREMIRSAIKSGDWKVDGACDPDRLLNAGTLTY